ncbi:hypothetical protein TNCV_5030571 [Trichonephila clavipes]|nr:hypothetical protein TNCV_5030571 [Trichonephila clavipes]
MRVKSVDSHCPPVGVVGCGSPVVKVSDRGLLCHGFEPSTTKDPPSCTLNLSSPSSRWCGVVVTSSTSDHGSKLRGPSPKALV